MNSQELKNILRKGANILFLNVSMKNTCDSRFSEGIFGTLLPQIGGKTVWMHEHVITSFICLSAAEKPMKKLGSYFENETECEHQLFLARSRSMSGFNIHILKTTKDELEDKLEKIKDFLNISSLIFIDFQNYRTKELRDFIIKHRPCSVAMIDGVDKTAFSEKDIRQAELEETSRKYIEHDKVKCIIADKRIKFTDMVCLSAAKMSIDENIREMREKAETIITLYFGEDGLFETLTAGQGIHNYRTASKTRNADELKRLCFDYSKDELIKLSGEKEKKIFEILIQKDWNRIVEESMAASNVKQLSNDEIMQTAKRISKTIQTKFPTK